MGGGKTLFLALRRPRPRGRGRGRLSLVPRPTRRLSPTLQRLPRNLGRAASLRKPTMPGALVRQAWGPKGFLEMSQLSWGGDREGRGRAHVQRGLPSWHLPLLHACPPPACSASSPMSCLQYLTPTPRLQYLLLTAALPGAGAAYLLAPKTTLMAAFGYAYGQCEQSRAEQSRAEQSRAEQSRERRGEQSRPFAALERDTAAGRRLRPCCACQPRRRRAPWPAVPEPVILFWMAITLPIHPNSIICSDPTRDVLIRPAACPRRPCCPPPQASPPTWPGRPWAPPCSPSSPPSRTPSRQARAAPGARHAWLGHD